MSPRLMYWAIFKDARCGCEVVVRCTSHLSGQSMASTRPQPNEHHSSSYNNIAFRVNVLVGFSSSSLTPLCSLALLLLLFRFSALKSFYICIACVIIINAVCRSQMNDCNECCKRMCFHKWSSLFQVFWPWNDILISIIVIQANKFVNRLRS